MFTGIIEEQGIIDNIVRRANLVVIVIRANKTLKGTKKGDSISINGCCLTVTRIEKNKASFDVMLETLTMTTLGALKPGHCVNLERAMTANGRFGGHFVTGHIDGTGIIRAIEQSANNIAFEITAPQRVMRYLVIKGSVTLEGISLTVGQVKKGSFFVHLIPATLKITTFGQKIVGDRLNIETDILARYILR